MSEMGCKACLLSPLLFCISHPVRLRDSRWPRESGHREPACAFVDHLDSDRSGISTHLTRGTIKFAPQLARVKNRSDADAIGGPGVARLTIVNKAMLTRASRQIANVEDWGSLLTYHKYV